MITAVDTNVLVDVFGNDLKFVQRSAEALRRCLKEGGLVACDVVWAEAALAFNDARLFMDAMTTLEVSFSPMTEQAAIRAGQAWRSYRAGGGGRNRIAADFLIGAHAVIIADRLLTRDRGFFRKYFTGLSVLNPTQ